LLELYSQTKIKQKSNADRGRNFGGNNAPSWAFISSSNRVAGLQRAGFVCQKRQTNKQESSEKLLPDSKAEKRESKSQRSSTSFYLLIKGWPDYFTSTQLFA